MVKAGCLDMSAVNPRADIARRHWDVRFVPITGLSNLVLLSIVVEAVRRWRQRSGDDRVGICAPSSSSGSRDSLNCVSSKPGAGHPHKYLAKPSLAGRKVSWSSLRNPFIAP